MGSSIQVLCRLAPLLAFPGVLSGQFRNLSTIDDGSLLVFSSSLRLQGTEEFPHGKLFSIDSRGVSLYEQRREQDPAPDAVPALTNYYLLEGAEFSGDGSVRALISRRGCPFGGSSCFTGPPKV